MPKSSHFVIAESTPFVIGATALSVQHLRMEFGDRLRFFRTAKGLSQAELAEAVGLSSQGTIGNYENNTRQPSLEHLVLIARALGIPVGPLIDQQEFATLSPIKNDAAREANLLGRWRTADEHGKYIIDATVTAAVEQTNQGTVAQPGEAA